MKKLVGHFLLLLLCWSASGGVSFAETEEDPFGTGDIFVLNSVEAAKSEFYCANYKLSEKLRMASAEMMQADIQAQGQSGSTFNYSADVFTTKKKIELDMLGYFSRPDQRPSCEEIKAKCLRRLLETKKKSLELTELALKKAAGSAISARGKPKKINSASVSTYEKGYGAGCATGKDLMSDSVGSAPNPPSPSNGSAYTAGWLKGLSNCGQKEWEGKMDAQDYK